MKLKNILMFLIIGSMLTFIFIPFSKHAYAENVLQNETGISDFYLYNELLQIANQGNENPYTILETNALLGKEEIIIRNSQIQSLEGLNKLNLSTVKKLNLSGNLVSNVTSEMLSSLTNLQELNLSNNNLEQIDISGLTLLNTLILNNNLLTEINLSNIVLSSEYGSGYVNLKNNKFTQLENIILPNEQSEPIIVDLNNNYLVNENITTIHTLNFLFQGAQKDDILLEGSFLKVYESDYYLNFNVKLYDAENNLLNTIYSGETFILNANTYTLRYFDNNNKLYLEETQIEEFKPISFTVKLLTPTLTVKIGDEIMPPQQVYNKPILLQFSTTTINENAEIYYSINNQSWVQGSEVQLTSSGVYDIQVKIIANDISSDALVISLQVNNTSQNAINIFKTIGSILLLFIMFILGYSYYIKKTKI